MELALALKFLSNVDLAYHWNWFDREVFLSLWIAIFFILGLYLLGKLRFYGDKDVQQLTIPRLVLSIIMFSFVIYMVPGLWGAPLKSISAFLPPQSSQDFDLYTSAFNTDKASQSTDVRNRKYSDIFHAPLNLQVFFDYEEGIQYAQKVGKPVMLDFTGHACVNCRKMETNVWSEKNVYQTLDRQFVIIQLYVDDKTTLPVEEQYVSGLSSKKITTIGSKWSDFQASRFNANSQPYYVLMNPYTEQLLIDPTGADYDAQSYYEMLNSALKIFNQ